MLIATITALVMIFGGSQWFDSVFADEEERIKTVLPSGDVRDDALDIVSTMRDAAEAQTKLANQNSAELNELFMVQQADEIAVQAVLDANRASTLTFQRELIAQRSKLRQILSREQWQVLYGSKRAELNDDQA